MLYSDLRRSSGSSKPPADLNRRPPKRGICKGGVDRNTALLECLIEDAFG